MRRYAFYIAIALVAFEIGSSVVFRFYWKAIEQPMIDKKVEFVSVAETDDEIKFGCKETAHVAFWEKLVKRIFWKPQDSK